MPVHSTLDPIEATAKAVDALLTAIDRAPSAGAAVAYRGAIARHGRSLAAGTGTPALDRVITRIRADAPNKAAADEHEAIVRQAWSDLFE